MVAKGSGEEAGSGDVKIEDLRVVCGGCCQIISCYCLWPDCFGCVTKQECLCCEIDLKACKFLDSETQDGRCCALQQGGCFLKYPETLCQSTAQCFCCDQRSALPCTDDVPCIFTCVPFCTVCYDWKVTSCPSLAARNAL
jgi:hypothetical protein